VRGLTDTPARATGGGEEEEEEEIQCGMARDSVEPYSVQPSREKIRLAFQRALSFKGPAGGTATLFNCVDNLDNLATVEMRGQGLEPSREPSPEKCCGYYQVHCALAFLAPYTYSAFAVLAWQY